MDLNLHSTDDELEYYSLGRLSDSAVPVLEEHLMACAACRDRLDQIEAFALGMRQALQEAPLMQAAPRYALPQKKHAFWFVPAAVAFAAIVVFYAGGRPGLIPAASLQLTALRGDMQFAPQSRELDLTLTDVPSVGGPFRVKVVDATGNAQWDSLAGKVVKVQRQLKPGDYFVRLYGPGKQVLHEYGFRIRS